MRQAGESCPVVAKKFRIPRDRMTQILKESEKEKSLLQKSAALLEEIRQTDDLDWQWHAEDLVRALGVLPMTKTALLQHFKQEDIEQISLRELMDLAFSDRASPELQSYPALFRVRMVGKYGFWSVVRRLTELDLGHNCNREWQRRLRAMERVWGIKIIGRPWRKRAGPQQPGSSLP